MSIPSIFAKREGEYLGAGGFGVVFKQDIQGTQRAVKWLKDGASIELVQKESEAMIKLKHENLVEFVGLAISGKGIGLIMELMTGGDLNEYLHEPLAKRERTLTAEMQKRWSLQITSGLEYIHSEQIVHRDMKSMNVLLTGDLSRAKISDFGLAKAKSMSKSSVGERAGTEIYWAPELKNDRRNTPESDVYALGMIIYEIYARASVDDEFKDTDVEKRVKDPSVKQIIQQCLSVDKRERPSCAEIIQALHSADESLEVQEPEEQVQRPRMHGRALLSEYPRLSSNDSSEQLFPNVASLSLHPSAKFKSRELPAVGEKQDSGYNTPSMQSAVQEDQDYKTGMEFYEIKQYKNAIIYLEKAANRGHTEAEFRLGHIYDYGKGVQEDFEKAMLWHMRAAKKNHYDAMASIARLYLTGQGVDRDVEKAMQWYERALEGGSPVAQCGIGSMHREGIGFPQDYTKAAEWYLKAAKQGYVSAQINMGRVYEDGEGVTQDYGVAMEWYQKAADQGNVDAQCRIGVMYENGTGVTRDHQQAMEWFKKSADQGVAAAQFSVGYLYENGNGVKQDYKQAIEWYLMAAYKEFAPAQSKIGNFYKDGTGVEQDYKQAATWYLKAVNQGDLDAAFGVGYLYRYGLGIPKNYPLAKMWYRKAMDGGHPKAQQEYNKLPFYMRL